jgi:hypothetical protein
MVHCEAMLSNILTRLSLGTNFIKQLIYAYKGKLKYLHNSVNKQMLFK